MIVVPIKLERAWLTLGNKCRRLTECRDGKQLEADTLWAELELTSLSDLERHFATWSCLGPPPVASPPPVGDAVAAPTVRQRYNKLLGEIAILDDLLRETRALAEPYNALAVKNNWASPVEEAQAAAVADAPAEDSDASSGSEDEFSSSGSSSDDDSDA